MFTHLHTSFSRRGLAMAAVCAAAFAVMMQSGTAQAASLILG